MSDRKFHQVHLQLDSSQLIELYTWLHNSKRNSSAEILYATVIAHMLANLDACKKPYVAIGEDLILPMTNRKLEQLTFGGQFDIGTAKDSPADHLKDQGPYKQSEPDAHVFSVDVGSTPTDEIADILSHKCNR